MSLNHDAALALHKDRHQRFLADAAEYRLVHDTDAARPRRTRRERWIGIGHAVRGVLSHPLTPHPHEPLRSTP